MEDGRAIYDKNSGDRTKSNNMVAHVATKGITTADDNISATSGDIIEKELVKEDITGVRDKPGAILINYLRQIKTGVKGRSLISLCLEFCYRLALCRLHSLIKSALIHKVKNWDFLGTKEHKEAINNNIGAEARVAQSTTRVKYAATPHFFWIYTPIG